MPKWVIWVKFSLTIGRKTPIFSYTTIFRVAGLILALSDTYENTLPPNLVPGSAKMVPKKGNMDNFSLTSILLVVKRLTLFLSHHF